jgi:hypothetical protein
VLFLDWYGLYREEGGASVATLSPALLMKRRKQKQVARLLGRWADKAGPLLLRPGLKRIINHLLAVLAWQRNRLPSCPPIDSQSSSIHL